MVTPAGTFTPVRTKASTVLETEEEFSVTVFEPKKAKANKRPTPRPPKVQAPREDTKEASDDDDGDDIDDIFADARRRKKRKPAADPQKFDMGAARREVVNFGITGFDKQSRQEAKVALAIRLGAKPPKKAYRNYKEILAEKKAAKEENSEAVKRRTGQMSYGAVHSYQAYRQRKREKEQNPGAVTKHYGVVKPRIANRKRNRK